MSNFTDYIYLSVYGIKLKSEFKMFLDFSFGQNLKYIIILNLYEFGNNKIISHEVKSNLKSDEYNVENGKKYITLKSSERYSKYHLRIWKVN